MCRTARTLFFSIFSDAERYVASASVEGKQFGDKRNNRCLPAHWTATEWQRYRDAGELLRARALPHRGNRILPRRQGNSLPQIVNASNAATALLIHGECLAARGYAARSCDHNFAGLRSAGNAEGHLRIGVDGKRANLHPANGDLRGLD